MTKFMSLVVGLIFIGGYVGSPSGAGRSQSIKSCPLEEQGSQGNMLRIEQDVDAGTISVFRDGGNELVLTQNARRNVRPYIHPIMAPDGNGVMTQYRPEHHLHQTGLYWGLKRVNGRDYFTQWQGDHWRRVSANVVKGRGQQVKWQTVYDLLDEKGNTVLTETKVWSARQQNGRVLLNLEWRGEAETNVTMGEFFVGGLFLRMPWHEGIRGDVVNSSGQRNSNAEAQRAIWTDVGVAIEGRDNLGHIALFDHPDNAVFPTPWRVDSQLGVGPSRQILGDWKIPKGETEVVRYGLVVYTGPRDSAELTRMWTEFASDD